MGNLMSKLPGHDGTPLFHTTMTASSPGSSRPQSTATDGSDVQNFIWLEGSKFHDREGVNYFMPINDVEIDRLNTLHFTLKAAFQGNFLSPVKEILDKGGMVLDSGCGPGSWTLDMATDFPNSTFVGVDIVDTFPADVRPKNCEFHLADLNQKLQFKDAEFDLVYQRGMLATFQKDQWVPALTEMFRCIKPGGYIEIMENDVKIRKGGPYTKKMHKSLQMILLSRNIEPKVHNAMSSHLAAAGFVDLKHEYISMPIAWGGRIGELFLEFVKVSYMNAAPLFKIMLGLSTEDYNELIDEMIKELRQTKSYMNYHSFTARRPLE